MRNHEDMCSIIILSYNQVHYTKLCLESIRRYTDCPYEIIVVDNASDEETVTYLEEQKDIRLIKNKSNMGFAGGCNQGMKAASGNYFMLLNNDTIVTRGWLTNMVKLLVSDESIGMVGPLTNSTVGKQMISVPYGEDMEAMHCFAEEIATAADSIPWRTLRLVAFCVLIRRSLVEEIGFLDEAFQIGNYEDDDFNIRALLTGKKLYICRNSFIHHFMNISFKKNNLPREQIMHRNKLILEKKWDYMDWNHHAVFNNWMLQRIREHQGKNILHIGCGLGALAVELKDWDSECNIIGVEDHPIRRGIAEGFTDRILKWDEKLKFFDSITNTSFDTIIIECMLEKAGFELINKIKPLLNENSQILLRVFNIKHISTLERILNGSVEGELLCASSAKFSYYFDSGIEDMLEKEGLHITQMIEVKKSLSILQEELLEKFDSFPTYQSDGRVYNRIYQIMPQK